MTYFLALWLMPAWAERTMIALPTRARYGLEDYLTHVYRQIPLAQLNAGGRAVEVTGKLIFDLRDLDDGLRSTLRAELTKVVAGRRRISGALFDFSKAHVALLHPAPKKNGQLDLVDNLARQFAEYLLKSAEGRSDRIDLGGYTPEFAGAALLHFVDMGRDADFHFVLPAGLPPVIERLGGCQNALGQVPDDQTPNLR